jgi:hypothetical protein
MSCLDQAMAREAVGSTMAREYILGRMTAASMARRRRHRSAGIPTATAD